MSAKLLYFACHSINLVNIVHHKQYFKFHLSICIAQFYGDITLLLILESYSLHRKCACSPDNKTSSTTRTCTPDIAFTTVDFPWATWPIVPMLIVAWRPITSGDKGVNLEGSSVSRSCLGRHDPTSAIEAIRFDFKSN
jgi:hypothetical protein